MIVSLLISTYNWPEALQLVLLSVVNQTQLPDEILIADDGSREDTKQMIERFKKKLNIPIYHFWHEDLGFRKSIILNKAISAAHGDYIIQVDGDCIMHANFIEDHLSLAKHNTYLFGSRVNIKKEFVPKLFSSQKISFGFFHRGIKKRTRNLRIPFLSDRSKPRKEMSHKMRGCNVSFWRDDVIAVNGYDEDFEGWGREDSEIIIRMMNNGVQGRRLRYKAIVYHIWHKIMGLDRFEINDQIQEKTIAENKKWCAKGIDQYL
ncbi:glycosyltransferase family 2 protein [Aequorivita echinoideorum]|uniref:Glycosyltransferase family 2 protein n=1 Tax=Aequorivita echinoideorum TaxID=1549647 RepID=A0ABS5S5L0_9FLAO|nr:glycosyltransferase family 2 protein [Aequorivita echinoideorum]MBT0608488.1 glycosyltransferase family 2 protein [Aequorivita echinoideorum]